MTRDAELQSRVLSALSVLIGKPLWLIVRALDVEMFHFGGPVDAFNRRNQPVKIGEFGLHVAAPWRLIGPKGLIVGAFDRFVSPSNVDRAAFDRHPTSSMCEEKVKEWLNSHQCDPIVVQSVTTDLFGGFQLQFSKEFALQVFPCSNDSRVEHWRLFSQAIDESPHFVVEGQEAG